MSHLGGYIEGGDPAAWYPHLWEWLVAEHHVRSVIDVGCGEGHALRYFRDELDCTVQGIDGVSQADPDIKTFDFTNGPVYVSRSYDLCWSCEFVEHVEERYINNYLDAFRAATSLLAMTHALPGQGGHHHVHERDPGYWLDLFSSHGFALDAALTNEARLYARCNVEPANYFARTGLVFRRTS
jgi:hypothetical protein